MSKAVEEMNWAERAAHFVGQTFAIALVIAMSFVLMGIAGAWVHLFVRAAVYGWEVVK